MAYGGVKGSANLQSDVVKTVGQVFALGSAVVEVSVCNRNSDTTARIKMAVTNATDQFDDDAHFIEYDAELGPRGVLQRTGINISEEQYVTVSSDTDNVTAMVYGFEHGVAGEPTYNTFALDADSYDEGDTVTVSLTTSKIAPGTTVTYNITAPDAADASVTSGTITVGTDRAGSDSFTLTNDNTTEGSETLTVRLASTDSAGNATGSLSDSATINDTSLDPSYDTFELDETSYDEGDTVTVDLTTTSIAENTTVTYDITGVQSNDVSKTSGTITIGADGTGTDTFTTTTGGGLEGTETITVTLRATDSSGNATGSLSDSATLVEPVTASVTADSDTVTAGNSLDFRINPNNYPTGYQATYRVVNGTTNSSDFSGGSGFYNTGTQSGIFNTGFGGSLDITINIADDADATNETFQVEVLKPDNTRAGISGIVTIVPS